MSNFDRKTSISRPSWFSSKTKQNWQASMGHIGLSACQVSRKSIQQFLRSDPGQTEGGTEPILRFHFVSLHNNDDGYYISWIMINNNDDDYYISWIMIITYTEFLRITFERNENKMHCIIILNNENFWE